MYIFLFSFSVLVMPCLDIAVSKAFRIKYNVFGIFIERDRKHSVKKLISLNFFCFS